MTFRPVVLFIGGFSLYIVATLAVLTFYKDDPGQMTWQHRENFNAKIIGQYKHTQNLTQQDVINRLGGPDITEAIDVKGDVYQLLYYRTHRKLPDGITTEDECTAMLFANRQLVSIGEDAILQYQQYVSHDNS